MFLSTLVRGSTGAGKLICQHMSIKFPQVKSTKLPHHNSSQINQISSQVKSIKFHLSANGTSYVAPIPLGQEAPVQVVVYQPPPGYALVPLAEVSYGVFNDQFSFPFSH